MFCTSLPMFGIVKFNFSHSNGFEVVSHGSYKCTFLMTNDVEHIFRCLLVIFMSSFME